MKPYNTGTRMSYGTQPSLFDSPTFQRAIHRASDPDTSRQAAEEKRATIATARERMLEIFRDGAYTANEAAMCCRGRFGELPHETYRKRKGELTKAGLIRCVGKRKCLVTGSTAEVWEVV